MGTNALRPTTHQGWLFLARGLRVSESLRIVTAGSHAVLELCRVAVSAYGSPLCMALHAMGNTDAGGGYYCGVSERANACVCARAALFASCVSHAMPRVALCRDKMLLGRHRARIRLCRGTAPHVYACRYTDRRVSRGAVSACCSAEDDKTGLSFCGYDVREFSRASEALCFVVSGN